MDPPSPSAATDRFTTSIELENFISNKHSTFIVKFGSASILTTVTSDSGIVTGWIYGIEDDTNGFDNLLVGLDMEWRPDRDRYYRPAATLQICVHDRCLIFQILHADRVPPMLQYFLQSSHYVFVGVDIESDLRILRRDHNFDVFPNCKDLRTLAAERYGMEDLKQSGLRRLMNVVLNVDMMKPPNMEASRWDREFLTPAQIKYAAIDAYAYLQIGKALGAASSS